MANDIVADATENKLSEAEEISCSGLDDGQKEAALNALTNKDELYVIKGGPGAGKGYLIAAMMRCWFTQKRGRAPSLRCGCIWQSRVTSIVGWPVSNPKISVSHSFHLSIGYKLLTVMGK